MQTFTGRRLCGQSHSTADVETLNVYACHYTLCRKWLGGIAMYPEASIHPPTSPESAEPSHFLSSNRGGRFFRFGRGCPLWFMLTSSNRYSTPQTLLELNEVDRRRLILAAETYMETQPMFWRSTGQYARLSGKEAEEMDYLCHLAYQLLALYPCQTEPHSYR